MNLSEFKAWFEGFSEGFSGVPSKKQWERIQAKIEEIKDAPATTYPVFVDRWVWPYRHYWGPYYSAGSLGSIGASMQCNNDLSGQLGGGAALSVSANLAQSEASSFNAAEAFHDLGRAEFTSMNA